MNLTDEEFKSLRTCKTEAQWNDACDNIKRARGGEYPPDWFPKVLRCRELCDVMMRLTR